MSTWIVTGAIAAPFLVMAIFLLNGKGSFLIAGYNTMDADKKATYDKNALCKAVGRLLIVLTVLMLAFPLAAQFEVAWLPMVIIALFMAAVLGFAIYANTGNRFRKDIDPGTVAAGAKRIPMTRGKKVGLIIGIVLSVQFTIGIGVMIYQGERDPIIRLQNDGIRISALYGLEIKYANIAEVALIDQSMREIGIGRRTDGYHSGGQALKGHFSSETRGQQLLFVYAGSSPTIQITRALGTDVFISFRDSAATEAAYRDLIAALSAG